MAVGEKVGVGSLRRTMVSQNLARLDFDLQVPGESFGQQESLTRRLKHILQMYPEGPRYERTNGVGADERKGNVIIFFRLQYLRQFQLDTIVLIGVYAS